MLKSRDVLAFAFAGALYGLMSRTLSSTADNPAISHSVALALWPFAGALAVVTGFIIATLSGPRRGGLFAGFVSGGFVFGALRHLLVQSPHTIAYDALAYTMTNAITGLLFELWQLAGGRQQRNA